MHPNLATGFQEKKHVDKNRNGLYSYIKLMVLTETNQHKAQYFNETNLYTINCPLSYEPIVIPRFTDFPKSLFQSGKSRSEPSYAISSSVHLEHL
jgi:hypothetical protein